MPWNFWTNYVFALGIVALILGGLFGVAKGLARRRLLVPADRRLTAVLESTALSQHSCIHVVKVGARYLLVGANDAALTTLAELAPDDVDIWLRRCRANVAKNT